MIPLTLTDIAQVTGGEAAPSDAGSVLVSAPASVDSRHVAPGGLFAAVVGERVDGHDYVAAALEAGASATLASRPVEGPHVVVPDVVAALGVVARAVVDRLVLVHGLRVIAITGSSGKTGTKDLLAQVLGADAATVAPEGSFNNELGVPLTALSADENTRNLIVEMGARGIGHIATLTQITPPLVGLVLNIGSAHAGEFGGMAATALAKSELVAALPDATVGGVAVLNADDDLVAAMASATRGRVVTFGTSTGADVRAVDVSLDELTRPSFVITTGGTHAVGSAPVRLQLHGAHQVSNALGVTAVALALGLPLGAVATALSGAEPRSRWRMQVSRRSDGVTVVNDAYNANPDSMRAGLEALAAMSRPAGSRSWAVLGEMRELGAASTSEHAAIGRLAHRLGVDRLVAVGAGARGIHEGAVADGARDGEDSVAVPDSEAAHALLRAGLRPGDLVFFKSSRDSGLRLLGDAVAGEPAR